MTAIYIRQDNDLAIAHFRTLGCTLTKGVHKGVWRQPDSNYGFDVLTPSNCVCYYVSGNGFENMTKSAFHRYLKRHGLRVVDQIRNKTW